MEIMLLRQKIIDEEMRVAQQERLADEEKVKERRLKDKDRVGLTRCNFCVKYKKYYGKNYPNCCLLEYHYVQGIGMSSWNCYMIPCSYK